MEVGGEASEGRESLIMNRSPTLAVRRCNDYAYCVGLDHYYKTGSLLLLALKSSKSLQSPEAPTCSFPSFLHTSWGLLFFAINKFKCYLFRKTTVSNARHPAGFILALLEKIQTHRLADCIPKPCEFLSNQAFQIDC